MIIFKTFQSASFMKTEYKGFEITVTREDSMTGDDLIFYAIFRMSDWYECDSGYDESDETPEAFAEILKTKIDNELRSSDPRGENGPPNLPGWIDRESKPEEPARVDLEESSFPLIPGAWIHVSLRLPPEELPVYTISSSGLIGVYARFGNNYSSLISIDNEEIAYWHESSVVQHIKLQQEK